MKRTRKTKEEIAQIRRDALIRARTGQSIANYRAILSGFMERGIPAEEILPRENVLTFQAWKAVGRHVRKGEHGIRVTTWVPTVEQEKDPNTGEIIKETDRSYCTSAFVFHVSQTDPDTAPEPVQTHQEDLQPVIA